MVYHLYSYFASRGGEVAVLSFTVRAMAATVTALVICLLFGHRLIRWLKRRGLTEPGRSFAGLAPPGKADTPTMGGLLILAALYASALLWCNWTEPFVITAAVVGLAFGALGAADDLRKIRSGSSERGLSRGAKYLVQITIAAVIAVFVLSRFSPITRHAVRHTLYVPFIRLSFLLGGLYLLWIIIFLVGTTNAVNLTDGMDGLAIVPVVFVSLVLGAVAYVSGHAKFSEELHLLPYVDAWGRMWYHTMRGAGELTVFCGAIAGAGIGFLWFNAHPATVFMGDTGSLALGGLLGIIAVLTKQEVLFFVAGGVFVLEVATSFIQDYIGVKLLGRRLFFRAPLHHSLLHCGTSESKVTVRMWILSALFAVVALCSLRL